MSETMSYKRKYYFLVAMLSFITLIHNLTQETKTNETTDRNCDCVCDLELPTEATE